MDIKLKIRWLWVRTRSKSFNKKRWVRTLIYSHSMFYGVSERYYLYRRHTLHCINDHGRHYGRLKKFDDANEMGVAWSSICPTGTVTWKWFLTFPTDCPQFYRLSCQTSDEYAWLLDGRRHASLLSFFPSIFSEKIVLRIFKKIEYFNTLRACSTYGGKLH